MTGQPTAAEVLADEVLADHAVDRIKSDQGQLMVRCRGDLVYRRPRQHAYHQANMLAAAGLLVTPGADVTSDWDTWVAARAYDEGHRVGWEHCRDGNYGTDYWDDDTPNPYRADRIERQKEGPMTEHLHPAPVQGCYRCDLSADEQETPHPCGDWPAPCNCDDPDTHDRRQETPRTGALRDRLDDTEPFVASGRPFTPRPARRTSLSASRTVEEVARMPSVEEVEVALDRADRLDLALNLVCGCGTYTSQRHRRCRAERVVALWGAP